MTSKKQTDRRNFFQDVSAGAAGMAFASVLSTLNAAAMTGPQKPTYTDKMDMSKMMRNVVREPNVVEFKPWKSIHDTITSPMITAWGAGDIPESKLAIGFAYITKPDTLGGDTHSHAHDQWIFLIGGDGKNFLDFDADAEMLLGDKVRKINYSCYFFIPKNTPHCPLVITRVGKPIVFIDARVNE